MAKTNFRDCIAGKMKNGKIPKGAGGEAEKLYEQFFRKYGNAEKAAQETANVLGARAADAKSADIKAALFQAQVVKDLTERTKEKTKAYNKLNAAQKALVNTPSFGASTREFLEGVYDRTFSIKAMLYAPLNDFFEKHGSKWAGLVQDTKGLPDIVREMNGVATGNKDAAMFAKPLREVFDKANKMFKEAGGIIGKIENYFPQHIHDATKVKSAGFDKWKAYILPRLDVAKMAEQSGEDLSAGLKAAYESITTEGLNKLQAAAKTGASLYGTGDVFRRKEASRFLHFKDAESFLEYNREFGHGDVGLFDAIIGHIGTISRDIGIMQMMGPKANGLMRHLALQMEANGEGRTKSRWTTGMYDVLAGRLANNGENPTWYKVIEGAKDMLRASLLGSAAVSAMTDSVFVTMAARMNGLKAVRAMGEYLKQFNPADQVGRRHLARQGYIAESLMGHALTTARMMEDGTAPAFFRGIANFTHRAGGLGAMTQIAKDTNVLLLQGMLAEAKLAGHTLADMAPEFQQVARERGITPEIFDTWMKADLFDVPEKPDVSFLRPAEIEIISPDAAMKLRDWENRLQSMSANEPTLRTRAITLGTFAGAGKEGEAGRAFWSSVFMFKSFGITQTLNYLLPAIAQASQGRLGNLAAITIGGTVLGAMVVQIKALLGGKDPQDMSTPRFWMAAALQGGGFGIWGDYLFSDTNRFGNGLLATIMGPVVGLGTDIVKLTKGNLDKAVLDGDANFLRDLTAFIQRYTPSLNLWYTKLIIERTIIDNIMKMVDDNFNQRVRRIEQNDRRERGQGYWWGRGETVPQRPPQMGEATK